MTPHGDAIKAIREARGISVRELARLVERDPGFIWRIEQGTRGRRSKETLQDIAAVLDVPIEAIRREKTP